MSSPKAPVSRLTCYRCFRPEALCYCAALPQINNRIRVTILQHPKEQFHPLNTARIAENGLINSRVIRASFVGLEKAFNKAGPNEDAAIVYPSKDAVDIEDISREERPSEIIVLDGTWHHAKTLLREIPALQKLRRIRFTPPAPSEYLIRKEPKEDYLSTIESVAHLLRVLEPETEGIEKLLDCFRKMIALNIQARASIGISGRIRKRQSSESHHFPEELSTQEKNVVILYCEGTSRLATLENAKDPGQKEPLIFVAERLDASQHLQLVMKGRSKAPARLLHHLALTEEGVQETGVSVEAARNEILAWLKPTDLLVAWNASSLAVLKEMGVTHEAQLQLKGCYCNYFGFLNRRSQGTENGVLPRRGDLDAIVEGHQLECKEPRSPGRAGYRLKQTTAILKWLRREQENFLKQT